MLPWIYTTVFLCFNDFMFAGMLHSYYALYPQHWARTPSPCCCSSSVILHNLSFVVRVVSWDGSGVSTAGCQLDNGFYIPLLIKPWRRSPPPYLWRTASALKLRLLPVPAQSCTFPSSPAAAMLRLFDFNHSVQLSVSQSVLSSMTVFSGKTPVF